MFFQFPFSFPVPFQFPSRIPFVDSLCFSKESALQTFFFKKRKHFCFFFKNSATHFPWKNIGNPRRELGRELEGNWEGNWKGTGKTQHFVHAEEKELEKQHFRSHPGKGAGKTRHFQSRPGKGTGKTRHFQSRPGKGTTTTTVGRPVTARWQGTKSPWHGGVQCLFPHACHCFATRSTATLDLCPNQTCGVDHGPIGLLGPVYHIYIYIIYIYIT